MSSLLQGTSTVSPYSPTLVMYPLTEKKRKEEENLVGWFQESLFQATVQNNLL